MAATRRDAHFDERYYAVGCGGDYRRNDGWLSFFDGVAARIVQDIRPASVLDAGCAMGFLVETLRGRGVDAWGIDVSEYAIGQVDASMRAFCTVGSITEPFGRRYDLITCIEVLEHLPKPDGALAIANLCGHTDDVLFSSTPNDHAEATHVNVQPPEYWAEQFARHGFFRDLDFDASFLTPWAARYRRRNNAAHFIVREYERALWQVRQENQQLRVALNEARTPATAHDAVALRAERDDLRELVQRYEQGKFMRLMRWWRGLGRTGT